MSSLDQLKKKYTEADLQQAKQLLEDFANYAEQDPNYSIGDSDCLSEAANLLPESFEEL